MGSSPVRRKRCAVLIAAVLLALLCAVGCGGGTTGTSDNIVSTRFLGTIQDGDGTPLSRVEVAVDETGDIAESDADGAFLLETERPGSEATLRLTRDDITGTIRVEGITEGNLEV